MNLNLRGFFLIYGPNSVRLDAIAVAVAQGMNISILGDRVASNLVLKVNILSGARRVLPKL